MLYQLCRKEQEVLIPPEFSLQLGKFSLRYAIKIMLGMIPFAFRVSSTQQECAADILAKVGLACMHGSHVNYLGFARYTKENSPFTCM